MKRIIPVTILIIILFFSPFFSVFTQAQSYINKFVVIENDPDSSGTYFDQGYTWHGYPVYKHASKNLYLFLGSHSDYPDYLLWLFSRCVSKENVTLRGSKNQIKMLPNDHEKCRDA